MPELSSERKEEICEALIGRIKKGKGLGLNPGIKPSGHFIPGPLATKFRTMSLAKAIGVPVEELEEFRHALCSEMKTRIQKAIDDAKQKKG